MKHLLRVISSRETGTPQSTECKPQYENKPTPSADQVLAQTVSDLQLLHHVRRSDAVFVAGVISRLVNYYFEDHACTGCPQVGCRFRMQRTLHSGVVLLSTAVGLL